MRRPHHCPWREPTPQFECLRGCRSRHWRIPPLTITKPPHGATDFPTDQSHKRVSVDPDDDDKEEIAGMLRGRPCAMDGLRGDTNMTGGRFWRRSPEIRPSSTVAGRSPLRSASSIDLMTPFLKHFRSNAVSLRLGGGRGPSTPPKLRSHERLLNPLWRREGVSVWSGRAVRPIGRASKHSTTCPHRSWIERWHLSMETASSGSGGSAAL